MREPFLWPSDVWMVEREESQQTQGIVVAVTRSNCKKNEK
jgi:hypothetical protein